MSSLTPKYGKLESHLLTWHGKLPAPWSHPCRINEQEKKWPPSRATLMLLSKVSTTETGEQPSAPGHDITSSLNPTLPGTVLLLLPLWPWWTKRLTQQKAASWAHGPAQKGKQILQTANEWIWRHAEIVPHILVTWPVSEGGNTTKSLLKLPAKSSDSDGVWTSSPSDLASELCTFTLGPLKQARWLSPCQEYRAYICVLSLWEDRSGIKTISESAIYFWFP